MICSFKKPGALAFGRQVCGLEVLSTTQECKTILPQTYCHTKISNNEFLPSMKCHMYVAMWLDLTKSNFHTHNSKTHFPHHTIAIHINQQFRQILVLKVIQATFAVVCLWGFSDVHNYLVGLKWLYLPWTRRQAGCKLPHDCLVRLAMNLHSCFLW